MLTKANVFFPIRAVITFLMISLVLYFISPFDWPTNHPLLLIAYNILIFLSLYYGFYKGYKLNAYKYGRIKTRTNYFLNSWIRRNLNLLLIINIIFIYPKFVIKLEQGYVNINTIVNSILLGLVSPEIAYSQKVASTSIEFLSFSHPLVFIYFLFLPLIFATVPIMVYLWSEISTSQKIMTLMIVIFDILIYVSIGTNKGIFDYVIMLPFLIYARRLNHQVKNIKSIVNIKYLLVMGLLSVMAISFFSKNIIGRTGKRFGYDQATGKSVNENAPLLKILPTSFHNSYISLDYYLTQGNYALDKSFDLGFKPCYGVGHSILLTSLAEKIIGKDVINHRLYQYRLGQISDYSQKQRWHSFYVSMANDLSFAGVVIFVFLLGYWFSLIWIEIVLMRNLLAVAIMPLFMIMFFYFGANNQVLGYDDQSIVFWVLIILFFYLRRKNKKIIGLQRKEFLR